MHTPTDYCMGQAIFGKKRCAFYETLEQVVMPPSVFSWSYNIPPTPFYVLILASNYLFLLSKNSQSFWVYAWFFFLDIVEKIPPLIKLIYWSDCTQTPSKIKYYFPNERSGVFPDTSVRGLQQHSIATLFVKPTSQGWAVNLHYHELRAMPHC